MQERRRTMRIETAAWTGVCYDLSGNEYKVKFKNASLDGIKFYEHDLPVQCIVNIHDEENNLYTRLYISRFYEDKTGTVYLIDKTPDKNVYNKIYNLNVKQQAETNTTL